MLSSLNRNSIQSSNFVECSLLGSVCHVYYLPILCTTHSCWHNGHLLFCTTHSDIQQLWNEWLHSPHTTGIKKKKKEINITKFWSRLQGLQFSGRIRVFLIAYPFRSEWSKWEFLLAFGKVDGLAKTGDKGANIWVATFTVPLAALRDLTVPLFFLATFQKFGLCSSQCFWWRWANCCFLRGLVRLLIAVKIV